MSIIKLDIDHARDYKRTKSRIDFYLKWINDYYHLYPVTVKASKTHKGFHFVISTARKLDDPHIVIFQLILGSDKIRELRNINRIDSGMTRNWNLLFQEKFTRTKTISRERIVDVYGLK